MTKRKIAALNSLLLLMLIVVSFFFIISKGYAESKAEVKKFYTIGEEKVIKPTQMIAARNISVGTGIMSIHHSWTIHFLGRESENSISLEIREKEMNSFKNTNWEEKPRTQIKVFIEKDDYTIFEIGGLTLKLKPSGNNLLCSVVGDKDNPYKQQTSKVCPNGHKWEQQDYNFCPTCGEKLK